MNIRNTLGWIVCCTCLVVSDWAATSVAAEEHRNLKYAEVDGIALRLDLYLPEEATEPAPLVVWIHGGGWKNGSKDRCPFKWLTEHGFAVASIQYRLTDKASFPAQIHDCKGAIRWLRAHADKYKYNADRIGALGISAGGHLVALLGTSGDVKELEGDVGGNLDQSSRIQAVLDMCGPADFLITLKRRPKVVLDDAFPIGRLLQGSPSEKRELAKLASPVTHVTQDDPPLMIFHGTADAVVHPRQSERMKQVYEEAKLPVMLEPIEGGSHVPKGFWDKRRRGLTVDFFDKHLRSSEEAPATAS